MGYLRKQTLFVTFRKHLGQGQNHQQWKNNHTFAFDINTTKSNLQKKQKKIRIKAILPILTVKKKDILLATV